MRAWLSSLAATGSVRWISMSCSPWSSSIGLNFSPGTPPITPPIAPKIGITPKLGSTFRFFS